MLVLYSVYDVLRFALWKPQNHSMTWSTPWGKPCIYVVRVRQFCYGSREWKSCESWYWRCLNPPEDELTYFRPAKTMWNLQKITENRNDLRMWAILRNGVEESRKMMGWGAKRLTENARKTRGPKSLWIEKNGNSLFFEHWRDSVLQQKTTISFTQFFKQMDLS